MNIYWQKSDKILSEITIGVTLFLQQLLQVTIAVLINRTLFRESVYTAAHHLFSLDVNVFFKNLILSFLFTLTVFCGAFDFTSTSTTEDVICENYTHVIIRINSN